MSAKNLTFADKQRIYDENLSRERRFSSLAASQDKPEYFLNPFRGSKHQAVADQVGGARGNKFLSKDEAFKNSSIMRDLNSRLSERRARSASPASFTSNLPANSNNGGINMNHISSSVRNTPLPDLRQTPTPNVDQQQRPGSVLDFTNNNQQQNQNQNQNNNNNHFVSPTPSQQQQQRKGTTSSTSDFKNHTGIYDTSTSFGRSLLRMRMSNAVLKPRIELHGDAIKFDQDLKTAQRPPQQRYGYPRTRAQEIGWYNQPLEKVDKAPANSIDAIKEYDEIVAASGYDDNDGDDNEYLRSDGQQFLLGGASPSSVAGDTTNTNHQSSVSQQSRTSGANSRAAKRAASQMSTRMSTGGYYMAKGLKTQSWN